MFLSLLLLLGTSLPSFAISEVNYGDTYKNSVLPYYLAKGVESAFLGKDGIKLTYRVFEVPNKKAKLVILPGRTEPLRKYAEVIYDLKDLGFSIYILEHRGQGESERIAKDPEMQYVNRFDDYIEDLDAFVYSVVKSKSETPLLLLAHSMGGTIGALYTLKHPHVFKAAVLSSPMFGINTAPYPEAIACGISAIATGLGLGQHFAIGQGAYDPIKNQQLGSLTLSQVRHDMSQGIFEQDPRTRMGGVSYGWLSTSFAAMQEIARKSEQQKAPVLVLQAGQDTVVRLAGEDRFCSHALSCKKVTFPESRHEILMERDEIRDKAFEQIKMFLLEQTVLR